jgi:hypothetical protein
MTGKPEVSACFPDSFWIADNPPNDELIPGL